MEKPKIRPTPAESKPLSWQNLTQLITPTRRPPVPNFVKIRTWKPLDQLVKYEQNFIYKLPEL